MWVPDGEIESEALRDEKLQLKHVCRFCPRNMSGIRIQRDRVIRSLRCEEEGRQPIHQE